MSSHSDDNKWFIIPFHLSRVALEARIADLEILLTDVKIEENIPIYFKLSFQSQGDYLKAKDALYGYYDKSELTLPPSA